MVPIIALSEVTNQIISMVSIIKFIRGDLLLQPVCRTRRPVGGETGLLAGGEEFRPLVLFRLEGKTCRDTTIDKIVVIADAGTGNIIFGFTAQREGPVNLGCNGNVLTHRE